MLPSIAPLAESKESQSKGGVTISLAPNNFSCSPQKTATYVEVPADLKDSLALSLQTGGKAQAYKLVETTVTPRLLTTPERLAFKIKINNQMPRVFRGAGAVVLYNFGGKNNSVDQKDYAELNNLIVPPRTEAEITIYGPLVSAMPDKTTLGIFFYDVVTKTDQAGNITEKQNYEWYYNYQNQYKEEVVEVIKTKGWVRR